MMNFRLLKTALVDLLESQADGRFRVLGRQVQSKNQNEFTGNDRMVQVYYSDGNFKKSSGRMRGPLQHDITIDIDLTASAAATGDVSVLLSETSTPQQKAAALLLIKEATEIADTKIDELIDAVFNILIDARNFLIDLSLGDISNRWIETIQKDTLLDNGDLVVKTANLKFSCRVVENTLGATPVTPSEIIFDSEIPVNDTDGAGVIITQET